MTNLTACSPLRGVLAALACAAFLTPAPLHAEWTTFSLPTITGPYATSSMDHLSDGRIVYGTFDLAYRQRTFGAGTLDQYAQHQTWDPASVTILSDTVGVISQYDTPYLFNPSDLNTTFTPVAGLDLQIFSTVARDSGSFYVGGGNGSPGGAFGGRMHAISYVTTDGLTNKIIINDIATFSGAFTADSLGNLYVTNPVDKAVYKFTALQIAAAISPTGVPLALNDGEFITTLPATGSIAVDALGRIWSAAAGFGATGFHLYDPGTGQSYTYAPATNNAYYSVATFATESGSYIGFLHTTNGNFGASVTYGYDLIQNVPEPSAILLLAGGATLAALRRRRYV